MKKTSAISGNVDINKMTSTSDETKQAHPSQLIKQTRRYALVYVNDETGQVEEIIAFESFKEAVQRSSKPKRSLRGLSQVIVRGVFVDGWSERIPAIGQGLVLPVDVVAEYLNAGGKAKPKARKYGSAPTKSYITDDEEEQPCEREA